MKWRELVMNSKLESGEFYTEAMEAVIEKHGLESEVEEMEKELIRDWMDERETS